jgi:putative transposase
MKEAYAVRRTVPPSAEIQASIDKLLSKGMVDDPQKMLSELARLGARLIIQRAVEDEFDRWLGRARYERRPERQRGLRNYDSGLRNGFRPRHLQTAEGELRIEIPQVRETAVPFVSKLFPKWHCKRLLRTDPLKALVIGGFVRGLSMRDVESLCEEAGLGKTSKSTVATICAELHERFEAFCPTLALRRQPGRPVLGRDLSRRPSERPEGGRDLRLGNRRERPPGAGFRQAGRARGQRGLARARP